ncbi:MAG: beta-lactamase family protein [Pirellulales bacterium]|nr:beta-lactamase family protein [Pirellulales bacterium]
MRMGRKRSSILWTLLGAAAWTPTGPSAATADQAAAGKQADAALIDRLERALPDSPGGCVLAVDHGRIVVKHAFGWADAESGVPCTPATNFRMASVSKQFTATAALMLVDRGMLSLDDALDEFFPDFPAYGRRITVRHLLTHTSGLPDYEELIPAGTTLQLDDLDVVQLLMQTEAPLFAPGERWQYSNSAFALLGLIVEIRAKKPFHQFMVDEIFGPLGMEGTLLYQRGLNTVSHRALGYEQKEGRWLRADQSLTSAVRGDGVVYTSLDDYTKWLAAMVISMEGDAEMAGGVATAAQSRDCECGGLLSRESHEAMFSPQEKTDRGESYYGYGWFIDEYRGTRRVHHNGDTRGFRLCVQAFPQRQAAVVLQFNSEVAEDMTTLGERAADLLIFDRQQEAVR